MPSTWNNQASKLMRVLIIDDHPLYIKGLESLLFELDPGIETHGARTTEEALEIASVTTFHLVLLDLKLPGRKDLQALAVVKAVLDAIPIVVVSGNDNIEDIWRAIEMGAAGFIPKDTDPAVVTQALRLVLARGVYIPPHIMRDTLESPTVSNTTAMTTTPLLSDRQLAVLQLLLQGKSNKLIASELGHCRRYN